MGDSSQSGSGTTGGNQGLLQVGQFGVKAVKVLALARDLHPLGGDDRHKTS